MGCVRLPDNLETLSAGESQWELWWWFLGILEVLLIASTISLFDSKACMQVCTSTRVLFAILLIMSCLSIRWACHHWSPGAQDLPILNLPCGPDHGIGKEVDPEEPVHEERCISSSCITGKRLENYGEVDSVSDTVFLSCGALYNTLIKNWLHSTILKRIAKSCSLQQGIRSAPALCLAGQEIQARWSPGRPPRSHL